MGIVVWIRNAVLIFLIMSIAYAILYIMARLRHRDKLNAEYEALDPPEDKAEFMAKGMEAHNRSYKPKLIMGVYVIPLAVMALLLYLANT